jgi:hypothetical protein
MPCPAAPAASCATAAGPLTIHGLQAQCLALEHTLVPVACSLDEIAAGWGGSGGGGRCCEGGMNVVRAGGRVLACRGAKACWWGSMAAGRAAGAAREYHARCTTLCVRRFTSLLGRRLHAALQVCDSLVKRHCQCALHCHVAQCCTGLIASRWLTQQAPCSRAPCRRWARNAQQAGTHVAPFAVVKLYAVAHCDEPTFACLTTGPVPRFCSIQLLTESAFRLQEAYSTLSALRYGLAAHVARWMGTASMYRPSTSTVPLPYGFMQRYRSVCTWHCK